MPKKTKTENQGKKVTAAKKPETTKISFYQAVGKRKESTARVRLNVVEKEMVINGVTLKKGEMLVNGRQIEKYFPGEIAGKIYEEPFRTTNTLGRFVVTAIISGGGPTGQLGAFIHGTARALLQADKEKFRPILKKRGFLTRDSRAKERRKTGLAQKARAKKQSPKR